MKKMFFCSILFLLMMCGMAQAELTTIGTTTYNGHDYKLIWDDDNNGNSVVWLDYTSREGDIGDQYNWASSLNEQGVLEIHLYDGYTVDWYNMDGSGSSWRLPATVNGAYDVDFWDGEWGYGHDGTTAAGYNITTSELGHLFYEELGNQGFRDTSGNIIDESEYGLTETGDFDHLAGGEVDQRGDYWSGTWYLNGTNEEYEWYWWAFYMNLGEQYAGHYNDSKLGIALRNGQVSVVPIPGAILLLASGLLGMAAAGRKKGN